MTKKNFKGPALLTKEYVHDLLGDYVLQKRPLAEVPADSCLKSEENEKSQAAVATPALQEFNDMSAVLPRNYPYNRIRSMENSNEDKSKRFFYPSRYTKLVRSRAIAPLLAYNAD